MSLLSLKKFSKSVTSLLGHSSSSETSLVEHVPEPKTDVLTVTVYQNAKAWDTNKGYIAAAISIEFSHRTAADIASVDNDELDQESRPRRAMQSSFRSEMAKTQGTCFQGRLKDLLRYRIRNLDRSLVSGYADIMTQLVNDAPGSVCVKSLEKLGVDLKVIKDKSLPGESGLAELMQHSTWLLITSKGRVCGPKGPPKPPSDLKTSRLSNDLYDPLC